MEADIDRESTSVAVVQRQSPDGRLSATPMERRRTRLRRVLGGDRTRSLAPLVVLVLVVILFTALNSTFFSIANARSLASQAAMLMVLGVGATFVILLGSIDLSVEGVVGMSSMVVALLVANTSNSVDIGIWAVLIALATGTLIGAFNGLVLTFMRVPSFMVTLGTWYVTLGIATVLFNGTTPAIKSQDLLDLAAPTVYGCPPTVFVALGVLVVGWATLKYTRLGRTIRAIGSAEEIVSQSGVAVRRYKVFAFMIAGTCSALAGVIACAQVGNGDVDAGTGMVFTTIAAVVVGGTLLAGGKGGVLNTVVGVTLLTVITDGMVLIGVSPAIQQSVQGVIVLVAVAAAAWPQRARLQIWK